jgi:hypothetical protein
MDCKGGHRIAAINKRKDGHGIQADFLKVNIAFLVFRGNNLNIIT